jgi:hypothetical protein
VSRPPRSTTHSAHAHPHPDPPARLTSPASSAQAIVVESKKEFKTFETKNCKANKYDTIETEEECTVAAVKLKLIDPKQTAKDDGHTSGVDDDPKGCYVDEKGNVMFNKGGTNKGSCAADKKCICSKCPGGGGSVPVDLLENQFKKIADIPRNAYKVAISVQSPQKEYKIIEKGAGCEDEDDFFSIKTGEECTVAAKELELFDPKQTAKDDGHTSGVKDHPKGCYVEKGELMFNRGGTNEGSCSADGKCICWKFDAEKPKGDLDVFLMEEGALPCKAKAGTTTEDDEGHECKQNMQEMTKTMSNGDKRMVPDPNYDQCLAGFECKNDADEFDPDDANHYKEVDGKTTTTPLDEYVRTKELKGMSIYFSGDDWVVPVTETVEIEKTTEEVSLWVYAYPKSDLSSVARCTAAECKDKDGNQAEDTVSGHNAGTCASPKAKTHICPKAVVKYSGTVTYSYEKVSPCDV